MSDLEAGTDATARPVELIAPLLMGLLPPLAYLGGRALLPASGQGSLTMWVAVGAVIGLTAQWLIGERERRARAAERRADHLALTDVLTGLANRRAFELELPREVERAGRQGHPLCLALVDVDHFRSYNDRNGYQAGDRALKEIAAAWREPLRSADTIARYGGDEMALVLPGCSLDKACAVLERMRGDRPGGHTGSSGVALWNGTESADEMLARVERALAEAKAGGRDRTVVAL
jgi:diguanylate cyclase (GGDEF)-like protein